MLEEINRSGGNGGACHAQMYTMGTVLRHGSDEQKRRYLPEIAEGRLRLQAFAVTEPTTGSDTTQLATRAERRGDGYVVNGQKMFISRAEHSDLMLLLARTTPLEQLESRSHGLSVFLVDLRAAGRRDRDPAARGDDEPPHLRGVHERPRAPRGQPDRRGGARAALHPRRHERRADPDRLRGGRRRPLVRRARLALRVRAGGVRAPDRREPGRPVPARPGLRGGRGGEPRALPGRDHVRRGRAVRARRRTWRSCSPRRRPGTPRTRA